jgi:hypothetical protein
MGKVKQSLIIEQENIDLDYGSALAAIAIETVARVASLEKI